MAVLRAICKCSDQAWLDRNPNTKGDNRTWNLWFSENGPAKANGFHNHWKKYLLKGSADAEPSPLFRDNPTLAKALPALAVAVIQAHAATRQMHNRSDLFGALGFLVFSSAIIALGEANRRGYVARSRLAAIVQSSDDAIISKDLNGVIATWNKGAERVFGHTAEEAVGQHITLIIPPDRSSEEVMILDKLRKGERIDHFETVRLHKNGTNLDISVTISPVKDAAGRVVGASKVARDITPQKQIERAMRDSEERFRSIVETTPECVKLVAVDGTLVHMNLPGLRIVGADCADMVVGENFYDLIDAKDRDRFRTFNERICRGEKGSLEFDIVGLHGQRRHMETRAAPLRNPDGNVVQLAVTRDVTDRVESRKRSRKKNSPRVSSSFRMKKEDTSRANYTTNCSPPWV